MDIQTIILIVSNIAVPILTAIITGAFQAKKYKKEIQILNMDYQNRERESQAENQRKLEMAETHYKNEIDKLKIQFQYEKELAQQKCQSDIVVNLTDKLAEEIIKQPVIQKTINQKTTQEFLSKKSGRTKQCLTK